MIDFLNSLFIYIFVCTVASMMNQLFYSFFKILIMLDFHEIAENFILLISIVYGNEYSIYILRILYIDDRKSV